MQATSPPSASAARWTWPCQAANDASDGRLLSDVLRESPEEVYGGLLATLLRLVFVLYAEDRGLVSKSPVYARHYAVSALFEKGAPISGDMTGRFHLWDAGTEVNEEPGFGPNQAPRQAAPNTGRTERKRVRRIEDVKDGFSYPAVEQVIRVTITPRASALVKN